MKKLAINMTAAVMAFLLGIGVFGLYYTLTLENDFSPYRKQQRNRARTIKATGKTIAVNAVALSKEYEKNEAAANDKYEGRVIEITGVIKYAQATHPFLTRVDLDGGRSPVLCAFKETERESVVKLTTGQTVTLTGKVEGYWTDGRFVHLGECKIK